MKKISLCSFYPIHPIENLTMDVVSTESFRAFLHENPVYRTNYFSIYLVTEGCEQLEVNGNNDTAEYGTIATSRPGEMWIWQLETKLEGKYLYFTEEFIHSFFHDVNFLDHFTFFRSDRLYSIYHPDCELFEQLLSILKRMEEEISNHIADEHVLRAMLYEVLALLERGIKSEEKEHTVKRNAPARGEEYYISQFQQLASTHFMSEHQVEFYASKLFITSNYLNKIVRQSLGTSTKQYVMQLLMNEAKRLLHYTTLPINDIAAELHMETAYFVKWFRQSNGNTPLQYRKDL